LLTSGAKLIVNKIPPTPLCERGERGDCFLIIIEIEFIASVFYEISGKVEKSLIRERKIVFQSSLL
jgi:hypothetical protein